MSSVTAERLMLSLAHGVLRTNYVRIHAIETLRVIFQQEEIYVRSSKEAGCFPYRSKVVCYMEVFPDGNIRQLKETNEKLEAYMNANSGRSTIYAVWPGQWRSDLFIIDDLEAFHEGQNLLGFKPRRSSWIEVLK